MKYIIADYYQKWYKITSNIEEIKQYYINFDESRKYTQDQIQDLKDIQPKTTANLITPSGKKELYMYYNMALFIHTPKKEYLLKKLKKVSPKFRLPEGGFVGVHKPYVMREGDFEAHVDVESGMTSSDVVSSYHIRALYYKGERLNSNYLLVI